MKLKQGKYRPSSILHYCGAPMKQSLVNSICSCVECHLGAAILIATTDGWHWKVCTQLKCLLVVLELHMNLHDRLCEIINIIRFDLLGVQEDASRRYMIQEDDETFQKYADVCIDEWRRQGKDTKPMELYMDTLEKYGSSVTRRV